MAYSAGMMKDRIEVLIPGKCVDGDYGRKQGQPTTITRWAAVDWVRGTKSLREGAVDAYDSIMVRMYYDALITRECQLRVDGVKYKIQSFHADKMDNTIQITASELQG